MMGPAYHLSETMPQPVRIGVLWGHKDVEIRLIGALIELCENSEVAMEEVDLARVTAYLADRYKDTK